MMIFEGDISMDFQKRLLSEKTTTTTTSSTTTGGGGCGGGLLTDCSMQVNEFLPNACSDDEFLMICDEFERGIGPMSLYIRRRLKEWCEALDYPDVSYAIGETAGAPRPSWRYCEAILWRLYKDNSEVLAFSRRSQQRVPPRKLGF